MQALRKVLDLFKKEQPFNVVKVRRKPEQIEPPLISYEAKWKLGLIAVFAISFFAVVFPKFRQFMSIERAKKKKKREEEEEEEEKAQTPTKA